MLGGTWLNPLVLATAFAIKAEWTEAHPWICRFTWKFLLFAFCSCRFFDRFRVQFWLPCVPRWLLCHCWGRPVDQLPHNHWMWLGMHRVNINWELADFIEFSSYIRYIPFILSACEFFTYEVVDGSANICSHLVSSTRYVDLDRVASSSVTSGWRGCTDRSGRGNWDSYIEVVPWKCT